MFFDGYPDGGKCPAFGAHEAIGHNFVIPHDVDGSQQEWRYCVKCHGMFYNGYPEKGVCPGGWVHEAAGYGFVVPHDIPANLESQKDWRYCGKCFGLFYDGYADKGRCPVGGGHSAIGYNFVVPHDRPPAEPAPWISVTQSGPMTAKKFTVSGGNFRKNLPGTPTNGVAIRVVDANAGIETRREHSPSNGEGAIHREIIGDISGLVINAAGIATIAFSATDGRPASGGFLWSNTVRINFP
jgi:hypothetical protein